jgi:hypothetical protein
MSWSMMKREDVEEFSWLFGWLVGCFLSSLQHPPEAHSVTLKMKAACSLKH